MHVDCWDSTLDLCTRGFVPRLRGSAGRARGLPRTAPGPLLGPAACLAWGAPCRAAVTSCPSLRFLSFVLLILHCLKATDSPVLPSFLIVCH